jgi:hypothetical protein
MEARLGGRGRTDKRGEFKTVTSKSEREREKKKTFGLFQMVFQNLSAAQKLLHSWFNGQ